MYVHLSFLYFAELVEDLNFERRRMAREQRMRQEEARKHQQMAIQKEQQREKDKQEAEMKKRMKRRRKRRIRRDGSGGSGGNNPVPGSGSEEEFFKGGRGSSNEDEYYDEYESDRYSGDEGMLSSGVEDDDNYFRRSKGVLFEEKGAKGPTRTAAANRERLAQTQSHNFKGNKTMSNNNNSADDLNYSPEEGSAAKK
jgi:hypothetical protein